jgi:hypothetical protein
LGWFRDSRCNWPDWTVRPLEEQSVELTLPAGAGGRWKVACYDTATAEVIKTLEGVCDKGRLRVPLPTFEGAIAFAARG